MDTDGMSLNMSIDIVTADLSASEFLGMCLGICDPLLDVFVVQETLLKALMLQPGIGQRHSSNTHIFTHPSTSHRLLATVY